MKNQYFGDINDYRKYGLLRAVILTTRLKLLVAWMLTPDDGGSDGRFITYLEKPEKWAHHDPELFNSIKEILKNNSKRNVTLIERTDLLPGAVYYSDYVPDRTVDRESWFNSLIRVARESDIVFLDPDNGMEVKSVPYGRKKSSKYLYRRELQMLWSEEKSLLIYQHFPRVKRDVYIWRMISMLGQYAIGSHISVFTTSGVEFFLLLQPKHRKYYAAIMNSLHDKWNVRGGIQIEKLNKNESG
jgi:hypothetical protein